MAAASAIYGEQYNPMMTVKSLNYFGDRDLHTLTEAQKEQLQKIASEPFVLPVIHRVSENLAKPD